MRWTGASEGSAKIWQSGVMGPSGAYLIVLMGKSDEVLSATLSLAGRKHGQLAANLYALRDIMDHLVRTIDELD
jgi:hypothetical protein